MAKITFKRALVVVGVLAASAFGACATTENVNQEAAAQYLQVKQNARQQGVLETSSPTAKMVFRVFNRMLPAARAANETGVKFNWEIAVVRSNELNAWAMPGGKMMFYTGLVERLKLNEAEIATIMGHEMAHALKEHGKKKISTSKLGTIAVAVADIGLKAAGIDTGFNREILSVTKNFALDKPFSRSNETEADEVGLFLMAKSGYDPRYAPNLWKKMTALRGDTNNLLGKLASTHPTNAERFENLSRLMPEAYKLYQQAVSPRR